MEFGITVLPDPPASRFVELVQHGERAGFEAENGPVWDFLPPTRKKVRKWSEIRPLTAAKLAAVAAGAGIRDADAGLPSLIGVELLCVVLLALAILARC